MAQITPNITRYTKYFEEPKTSSQKQYEALRSFFIDKIPAQQVAEKFGYTLTAYYSLIKEFKSKFDCKLDDDLFFKTKKVGRKTKDNNAKASELIFSLRKQYLSVTDIKAILDTQNYKYSTRQISTILHNEGFARLPRRSKSARVVTFSNVAEKVPAPKCGQLSFEPDEFSSQAAGILCLIPLLKQYGLDTIIDNSKYPETSVINRRSSILSFLALKVSNIRRYSADDIWCMDRGMGLFAELNVLPKTAWFSSYSHRITREMNLDFLRQLHKLWEEKGLLSDTINLDFTSIPYWGDDSHLENNWSCKRNKSIASILAVLAQEPDSGITDYGDTNVRHENQSDVVHEFLDFYRNSNTKANTLRYLIFDSKFTHYENLRKLDNNDIKFITIRRRGKNIVEKLNNVKNKDWKKIHVMNANNKGRALKIYEETIAIKDYDKPLRQVAITGHGKIKPALIITNDFDINLELLIRKYSRRWIIEKGISEQIDFFHLNRVSSSMVIKVDFDLTMTILAHNIYRLFANCLEGYSHLSDISIFEKFLNNAGDIKISDGVVKVILKKKRNLPLLLTQLDMFKQKGCSQIGQKLKLRFSADSTS